jgi:hypothetical protein
MPLRRDRTVAELREQEAVRREQNKLAQRRSRARKRDGQADAARQADAVSVTPPSPPALPSQVPPPEVLPQTPSPTSPPPTPLSPPLPPVASTGALARRNGHLRRNAAGPSGRPRDPIWDVLVSIFGEPSTQPERDKRNAACKQFKTELARLGMTEEEQAARIWQAHENYAERMPPDTFETPFALASNVSALVRPVPPRGPRVRREVVQRVTQYASRRVEQDWSELIDEAEREVSG